ncbi:19265_t:CDS:2 [Racocetra persica]|uniref:19265_t:CDS:1 n=1 Tax=Racocetra persica TaxID=160502 RepID=A0ACA9KIP8_9GLOM|nr:19265_t:CDS:2 [Racocetra persica]
MADRFSLHVNDVNSVAENLLNQFKVIGGRNFLNHHEANYFQPSDGIEIERSMIGHMLTRYIWQGNISAPVKEILENGGVYVLDVGCEAGYWILDVANDFPKSTFVGIDIVPNNFPQEHDRTHNVGFLEHNVLNGIPFPSETFDYVHMALMFLAFTEDQYLKVIHELVRVTKHNGWIEIMEIEYKYINQGNSTKFVQDAVLKKLKEEGAGIDITSRIPDFLRLIDNITDIERKEVIVPLGGWYGRFGEYVSTCGTPMFNVSFYLTLNMFRY